MNEQQYLCSICFQPISLEDCKSDERGRPVHENCYARKTLYALDFAGREQLKARRFLGRIFRRAPRQAGIL